MRHMLLHELSFNAAPFANQHPAGGDLQTNGPRDLAPHRLGGDEYSGFPKNPARGQTIPLADLKYAVAIQDLCAPGQADQHALRHAAARRYGCQ